MNRQKLAVGLLSAIAALPVFADPLQFANVTTNLFPSFTNNNLEAVTFGGSNSLDFVAVGQQVAYVCGNFVPGTNWFIPGNWAAKQINTNLNLNLYGVAAAGNSNLVVASGDNNQVFAAPNIFTGGLAWSNNYHSIFPNTALAPGVAYSGTNFCAVGEATELIYASDTNVPTSTTWNQVGETGGTSVGESFRGITAYTNGAFAACGVYGEVRFVISSAGSLSSPFVRGQVGQPNFYGIAFDGVSTLVCVGGSSGNGAIVVSTNNGATWQQATNTPAAASQFNSVAYTGSGFIAVGNNGEVYTNSGPLAWSVVPTNDIPAVSSSLNLNGVAFGSGQMHDVGEIVGDKGSVIVCAPPPPTNNSLGNKWICVGVTTNILAGTNVTLPANTLQVTNAWGTNIVTVDWYNTAAGGNPITNGTFLITTDGIFSFTPLPFITDNADNVTNTYYAQARDLRTGFFNTNRTSMTLTNFMRPTATMITLTSICNGDSNVTVQASLTGNGPWTNVWSYYWADAPRTYYFTNVAGTAGVFYTNNAYSASLILSNSVFNLTDLCPNAATNYYSSITKLADAFFPGDDPTNLNPPGTNWLGDLGGTNVVTVYPRPTSALTTTNAATTNEICNGDPATLTNVLSGLGPWTVYWTTNGFFADYVQAVTDSVPGYFTNVLSLSSDPLSPLSLTNGNPNQAITNFYWVGAVISSNLMSGHVCMNWASDLTGTNMVIIDPRPTSTSVTTNIICNGGSTTLTNILTGLGPWTVYWTDGFTSYTQAVSVLQPGPYTNTLVISPAGPFNPTNVFQNAFTNHYYWVTAVVSSNLMDGHVCPSWASDLAGTNLVRVYPRPTATVSGNTNICNGQPATVRAALTGTGPTWYIMWKETWPGGSNNLMAAYNTNLATLAVPTNTFTLTNSLYNNPTNYTFTVIGLSDSSPPGCGAQTNDLSGNAVVTVYPRPTATVSGTTNICNGQPAIIQAALTGTGPWIVTWGETWSNGFSALPPVLYTTSVATLVVPTNLLTLTNLVANSPTNYMFTVVALTDSSASGCGALTNDLYNSATVKVYPRPTATVSGSTNVCSGSAATIQAALTGTGPWYVTWNETWAGGSSNLMVAYNTNLATLTVPTNVLPLVNSLLNSTTNYTFTVTNLSDSSPSGCGANPGDLRSNAVVKVYPLPTATIIQVTNSYYNLLTFDDLPENASGILVTNGYAGLDWVNVYELDGAQRGAGFANGVISTNNVIFNGFGSPASITNDAPFNLVSAYMTAAFTVGLQVTALGYTNGSMAYSNVYTLSTNSPAFIVFNYTNVNQVSFSATNTDWFVMDNLTVKLPGPTEEICNGDVAALQAVLTGIGPWTVQWTDGVSNYTQVVNSNVAGPYTNVLIIPNTAFNPTNVLLNQTTNYVYSITSITSGTNASPCSGSILGGPATVTISPRPTAFVTGSTTISVTNSSPAVAVIQANLTGFGPWLVKWSDGTNLIYTNSPAIRYVTNSLNIITNYASTNYIYEEYTNLGSQHNANPGSVPGQAAGIYQTNTTLVGFLIPSASSGHNAYYTNEWELYHDNINIGSNKHPNWANYFTVQTNQVPATTSALSVTNLYSVMNLTDATCVALASDLSGSAEIVLSSYPSANISVNATNICLGNQVIIAATFSGTPPWTNYWSDGTTYVVTNTIFTRIVVPISTGWYTNTITNFVDGSGLASTNIIGIAAVYVNPLPAGIPASNGDVTNCAGLPNPPLTVTDSTPGVTINWYFDSAATVPVPGATNTTSFIPSDTAPGTNTYYAAEVNSSGCPGVTTNVSLILLSCTNPPAISLSGTNGTIIWFGNLILQSATNLAPPPVIWQNISTGMVSTNVFSFTNGVPPWTNPIYFFRLTN